MSQIKIVLDSHTTLAFKILQEDIVEKKQIKVSLPNLVEQFIERNLNKDPILKDSIKKLKERL